MEKIQELTEKIYREGVEKGQAEAERIIEEGRQKAADIVNEAKKQAEALLAQAKKQAVEVDTNTKNELKLYTNQALNALKSEVANVLTCQVVKKTVGDLVADKEFLGQFAVALAQKWVENEPVVISTEEADSLKAYFAAHAKELADLLGGVVACTRPLVEKGWNDVTRQIGLSGRTVKPKLIITCGVSGAVQFAAGMNGAECIVAINTDPEAPIFKIANFCIVKDLYEVVPQLTAAVRAKQH